MTARGTFVCLLLASAAAAQDTTTVVQVTDKISPGVQQALAQGPTTLPLFIELQDQPQAEILQRMEAESSHLALAKSTFEKLAGYRAFVAVQDLDNARDELDAAITSVRHNAAQAIQDQIRSEQDHVSGVLSGAGATGIQRYYIVNVLRADVPASAITAIAEQPEVARISLIGSGTGMLNTAAPLGAPAFWEAKPTMFTGKGQTVAVLDSGINVFHPAFHGVVDFSGSTYFLKNAVANPVPGCRWGEVNNPPTTNDFDGHGTAVADAVAGRGVGADAVKERGVAFGVPRILNVKVMYKCAGAPYRQSFQDDDVLDGLQYAAFGATRVASIINLSLGDGFTSLSDYVDRIVDLSSGLVVTVAAGNDGDSRPPVPAGKQITAPATAYNAITVGAETTDANGALPMQPAAFSSGGPTADGRRKPDLSAPGAGLLLANNHYITGSNKQPYRKDEEGTSFAAPQVAGAAALLLDLGVPNAVAVKALLINAAERKATDAPWTSPVGWGFMRLGGLPELLQQTGAKPVCETQSALLSAYASACVTDTLVSQGDKRYYAGSITGPFKATLVWNRHFTKSEAELGPIVKDWVFSDPPLAIDPLTLSLYHKQGLTFSAVVGNSNTAKDNVQQVNANETNDILVKVKLPGNLVPGVPAEPFGLAFNTKLTPKTGPFLGVSCVVPANIQPLQMVAVACTASNSGDLPVFSASATSNPGTVTNGNLGTISPGGSPAFTVNVTAPAPNSPAVTVIVKVAGTLADEPYTGSTAFEVNPSSPPPPLCPGNYSPVLLAPPFASVSSSGGSGSFVAEVGPGCTVAGPIVPDAASASYLQITSTSLSGQPVGQKVTVNYTVAPIPPFGPQTLTIDVPELNPNGTVVFGYAIHIVRQPL